MKKLADRIFFIAAGVLLVLMFGLMFFVSSSKPAEGLRYVGWVVWAFGVALIITPFIQFPRRGEVEEKKTYVHTTRLVDTGIYGMVRHPQYLGWLLMYPAMMCFTQHWLFVLLGVAGTACVLAFTRQEDQRLVEKFGEDYVRYMQRVPQFNIVLGIIHLALRR